MTARPFKKHLTPDDQWNRDRARIHALKNEVMAKHPGYSDDNYRDLINDVSCGRCDSSKELTPRERLTLIARLAELVGERPPHPAGNGYPNRPRNMDKRGQSRDDQLHKIEALLTVGGKPWAYADGIARRVCKVDKVQWVQTGDLYKIISALRYQAKRAGWDLSGEKR